MEDAQEEGKAPMHEIHRHGVKAELPDRENSFESRDEARAYLHALLDKQTGRRRDEHGAYIDDPPNDPIHHRRRAFEKAVRVGWTIESPDAPEGERNEDAGDVDEFLAPMQPRAEATTEAPATDVVDDPTNDEHELEHADTSVGGDETTTEDERPHHSRHKPRKR